MTIYTIGHSNRPLDVFLELLRGQGIEHVADVRTVPKSRHLHFSRHPLSCALGAEEIAYSHLAGLGGLRSPRADSPNQAWRHPGFRGYADHMQTAEFGQSLGELIEVARGRRVAIMCAEALWWRCHRRLIADALVVRHVSVLHIATRGAPAVHRLSEHARDVGGQLSYPDLFALE